MKALRALSKGVIEVVDVEIPQKENNILIKTELASICGSDLHMAFSGWGIDKWPAEPGHPGHEAIGTVISGNGKFNNGDLVLTVPHIWNSKCFAEFQSVDAAHILKIDQHLYAPIENLLMSQQLGTVIFAAKQIPIIEGKTCLVIGQGSAGLFWNFILKHFGAKKILSVEPNQNRLALSKKFGSDEIYYEPLEFAAKEICEKYPDSIDIVIEAVGTTETINDSLKVVKDFGEVVFFGLPETVNYIPFDFSTMFKNRVKAFTVFGSQDEKNLLSFQYALELISNKVIDMDGILSHSFNISNGVKAYHFAKNMKDEVIKVGISF